MKIMLALVMTVASSLALANMMQDKAKAEFTTKETALAAEMKTACGCAPKASIKWDQFKTEDDTKIPAQGLQEVLESFQAICKTDVEKKAVCKSVKSVVVNKGTPADPKFSGGTITLTREYNKGYGDLTELLKKSL